MKNHPFKLIKGGLAAPDINQPKTFVSAFATNTRLMGTLGVHAHWELGTGSDAADLHQFFYIDTEEFGIETFQSIFGNDVIEINLIETALMGGLGGTNVELSQKEFCELIKYYAQQNFSKDMPLPGKLHEYQFVLTMIGTPSDEDSRAIREKLSCSIESDYHAINYFLMRCASKDYEGAKILCNEATKLDVFDDIPAATLCRNSIDVSPNENEDSYLCESLLEYDGKYKLIISEITLENMQVTSCTRHSGFSVSPTEAAMMLSRPEFVTVYDILIGPDEFDKQSAELTINTLLTVHDNGKLFLAFNKNNDHVNQPIFRLNEDVYGLYYVTNYGQLIIASYSIEGIHSLEKALRKSAVSRHLIALAKYEFKDPILYEFIQSDFDDFIEFLDFIRNE